MMVTSTPLIFVATTNSIFQGNYASLRHKKEELRKKLAEKMEVCCFKFPLQVLRSGLTFYPSGSAKRNKSVDAVSG